jgi:hypothetical protein
MKGQVMMNMKGQVMKGHERIYKDMKGQVMKGHERTGHERT